MKNLSDIRDTVNDLPIDIKAEIIIADLVENGMGQNDYVVLSDGFFQRRFKKDISHTDIIKLNNGQEIIGIHLTREGLYDALPEAIFHNPPDEAPRNGHEMATVSKKQKMEEKECRTFFLPFENEIFNQKVNLELTERKILRRFSENLFNDVFPGFWNLDRSLPHEMSSKIMHYLHYAYRISGDISLTARALESILNESVTITLSSMPVNQQNYPANGYQDPSILGSSILGNDLVCGTQSDDQFTCMLFHIGPLNHSKIGDYLHNGPISKVLSVFYSFFVPLEILPKTILKGTQSAHGLILGDPESGLLGYCSLLTESTN